MKGRVWFSVNAVWNVTHIDQRITSILAIVEKLVELDMLKFQNVFRFTIHYFLTKTNIHIRYILGYNSKLNAIFWIILFGIVYKLLCMAQKKKRSMRLRLK